MLKTIAFACVVAGCLAAGAMPALAIDPEPVAVSPDLAPIRTRIKAKDFRNAAEELFVLERKAQNADIYNLLAFSLRNLGDYEQSALYYRKALDYDANHKGALEYQGELFVKLGDLAKAHQNLAKLAALCPNGCEELDDLREAIEKAPAK